MRIPAFPKVGKPHTQMGPILFRKFIRNSWRTPAPRSCLAQVQSNRKGPMVAFYGPGFATLMIANQR